MHQIGIDPGLTGALALLGPDGQVQLRDMPVKGTAKGNTVCAHSLVTIIRTWRVAYGSAGITAAIEQASARPGQGVASTCKTCRGAGVVEGVLAAMGVPFVVVTPQAWKRTTGLVRAGKDASRGRAMELYPQAAGDLHLKKHHGRAEALLIAHHALTNGRKA